MTGLSQYRQQQQQIIGQGVFPQGQYDNKLPALNARSMPKPIQKSGLEWPGHNGGIGMQSPSSHMVTQQHHNHGVLGSNMVVTSGGQLQQHSPNATVSGSEVAPVKKNNYQVGQHQKYMSGSILQVTSTSSAPVAGKTGGSSGFPTNSGPNGGVSTNSHNHQVSHSGSCKQPFSSPNKQPNSTSSANHKRNNQGAIFSMGIHGVDLTSKPAQNMKGARTPSSTDVVRGG